MAQKPPALTEYEQAMLLIAVAQTSLLAVIAAEYDERETRQAEQTLSSELAELTPEIAKLLVGRGR